MLKITNLKKTYTVGNLVTKAVDDISIEFRNDEFVAILGPSGCGKTTFLNLIGALDRPDSGDVFLSGSPLSKLNDIELDRYRNASLGFIFQTHNLIEHLSVIDNIEMSMTLSGIKKKERKTKALELLEKVGLSDHADKKPNQLSVGQRQRVAIARALSNDPDIILADEPTGSVDSKTSHQIVKLIKKIAKNKLVIMVTHDPDLAEQYATRVIKLNDGKVVSDSNPYDSSENNEPIKNFNLKKTGMSFKTTFLSAIKNLRTKIGRSILTAFASSIGILGFGLTLALSYGTSREIDRFDSQILGHYPINISSNYIAPDVPDIPEINLPDFSQNEKPENNTENNNVPTTDKRQNIITEEYLQYLKTYYEENSDELFSGLTIKYKTKFTIVVPYLNDKNQTAYSTLSNDTGGHLSPSAQKTLKSTLLPDGDIFDLVYDIIAGDRPESADDPENKTFGVVLSLNKFNESNSTIISRLKLKFNQDNEIPFDEVIGKELYYVPGNYSSKTFTPEDAIKLKITGIIRPKDNGTFVLFNSGIGYTNQLIDYVKFNYPETVFDVDYIDIYPNGHEAKIEIKNYLNNYNRRFAGPDDPYNIYYIDESETFGEISRSLINTITFGLIGFSTVSLIVASLMIAIITYSSVVERTNEIGIMRALGARKKDVRRTFNTENIIIGLVASIIGIVATHVLSYPLNMIVERYAGIKNITYITVPHTLFLIFLGVFVAIVAGFIPSRMAANQKPVESLSFR
ncbi:MAG: ATP-binding cassette domain-containing protein [Acholeplasmataceae bacterium]